MRSPPPEEEGAAAETTCDELTATPIPCPPVPLGGRRERYGSEAEPRKKGGVGGRCFKISFYFSLSYSDLIGDKFFFSPQVQAVLSVTVMISPYPYLDPRALCHISTPLSS